MFAHVRECEKQLKIVCEGECELESVYMCGCACVQERANPKGPEILGEIFTKFELSIAAKEEEVQRNVIMNCIKAGRTTLVEHSQKIDSSTSFHLIDFHTHYFRTYDCFLVGAKTTWATQREHLC